MSLTIDSIRTTMAEMLDGAQENILKDYNGQPVYSHPLVGAADGRDSLFASFRQHVSSAHILPVDILKEVHADLDESEPVRVISWAFPFTEAVRRSNRSGSLPSQLYSLARNNGGALNRMICSRMTAWLQQKGYAAVSPVLTRRYDAFRHPEYTFSSTWSERHAAYAAGLGLFGLNGALITEAGAHVRFGSIITNLPLPLENLPPRNHQAPCLESNGRECGLCIPKCPAGAISKSGLDKEKCYAMRNAIRNRFLEEYVSTLQMIPSVIVKNGRHSAGYSLGCALCQCGVPCEGADPFL